MMMKQQQEKTDKSNYPRTGKRGGKDRFIGLHVAGNNCSISNFRLISVPQLFPRKLYDMLDMESNRGRSNGCVSWSSCGRAFRIADVTAFSEEILPTYFKTSKFSSFQRNLNLVSCYAYINII